MQLAATDAHDLGQAAWRFEGLIRHSPADHLAMLGLLHIRLMLGDRPGADALVQELWGRRAAMLPGQQIALADFMLDIGLPGRACELLEESRPDETHAVKKHRESVWVRLFLSQWTPPNRQPAAEGSLKPLFAGLESIDLLPLMPKRQALTNNITASRQCGIAFTLGEDGEGQVALTRLIYVPGTYRDRRNLADELSLALERFYRDASINQMMATSLVSEVILPVAARPALSEPALAE